MERAFSTKGSSSTMKISLPAGLLVDIDTLPRSDAPIAVVSPSTPPAQILQSRTLPEPPVSYRPFELRIAGCASAKLRCALNDCNAIGPHPTSVRSVVVGNHQF